MMTFLLQDGCSPLHLASDEGHLDIVKTLIEAGANVNQANEVCTVGRYPSVSLYYIYTPIYHVCQHSLCAGTWDTCSLQSDVEANISIKHA